MIILVLIRFLSEFLQENNGIKKEKADIDAESMVFGGKLVKDGDYAILEGDEEKLNIMLDNLDKWRLDRDLTGKNPR